MENQKPKQRVVLNLSIKQAKELKAFLMAEDEGYTTATLDSLAQRILKTLTKHEDQDFGHDLAKAMGVTGPDGN